MFIKLDMGLFGMGLGRGVANLLNLVICIALIKYYKADKETMVPVTLKEVFNFKNWWNILRYSIPSGANQYLKWLAFEIVIIMVRKKEPLAA